MPSTRKLNKYFDVYTHTYDIYKYIYMRRLAFPLATQKEMTWITLLPTEKWIKCINYFLYPDRQLLLQVGAALFAGEGVAHLGGFPGYGRLSG